MKREERNPGPDQVPSRGPLRPCCGVTLPMTHPQLRSLGHQTKLGSAPWGNWVPHQPISPQAPWLFRAGFWVVILALCGVGGFLLGLWWLPAAGAGFQ